MFKRIIALLLSITLFISILPMKSYAETNSAGENKEEQVEKSSKNVEDRKEIVEERDAYSKTFVDEEGQLTKEVYAEPIHTKVDGRWKEISTDLTLNNQEKQLETETTQLEAAYPSKISSAEEINYTYGKHSLVFSEISASKGRENFSLNKEAKTTYDENKVLYENVLPGIDLRHVSLNNEVKEDWIIHDYQGINEFHYIVNTDLVANLEDDGSIGFYENKSVKKKVFKLPAPIMEDSNINKGLGSGVKSNDLHYELKASGKNQYEISLVVDKKWLESKDRVYPVYVDPSVTVNAMGDSFVSSAYPTTNYNKEWDSSQGEYVLKVGKYDSTTGTNYAFIKFSLTNLKGAVVDSADLKAYVTHSYYATQQTGLWVDRVTGPWYANELTWNNKPGSTNITSTSVARDQWATFNVKGTVQGWIDGDYGNDGFKFHTNGNGQTYWKKLSSAETANVAKLVISYHYPTMQNPSITAAQYGDGQTTGYVNVSWPAVYGANSYELQMYNGKSFETVYTGSGTSWSSKGKKIFPKAPYSTSSSYKLDGTGVELAVDPSSFYSAKSGTPTTRKDYGFKVKAKYTNGDSPLSAEVKKAIPASLVDIPNMPTVKAYAYSENDSVNKGRGWLDLSWDAVPGATGYKVLLLNGKEYEEFTVGNVTSWSTKGQKIWPTDAEIASGRYALHKDKLGAELAINPNPVYQNSGDYLTFKRYSIRIKAICDLGVTDQSDSQYGYIPLPTVKNIAVSSSEIVDDVTNRGALNIKWDKVQDAGGYLVEINDGSKYVSYDVGNVTSWNTTGISLFGDSKDLPLDPTAYYKENSAPQSLQDKKSYDIRVRAYTMNDSFEPPSETSKINGPRGVSAPSTNIYGSILPNDDLIGLEDYFTTGSHQLGNAEASVNVTTGNLNFSITDHSLFTRGVLGFDFTRYYNSKSTQSSALGKGWTFEGNESLIKKSSTSSNYYYWDEDGTRHEFIYNSGTSSYTSPQGKYITLKNETVNGKTGFSLKDKDGFTKYFELDPSNSNKYRLYAYQDANNNKILFRYTGTQLTEIAEVDAANNTIRNSITLFYDTTDTTGKLVKTSFKDRWIDYNYNSDNQLVNTTVHANGTTKTITNTYGYNDIGLVGSYIDGKNHTNTFNYETNSISVLTPQEDGLGSVKTDYTYNKKDNNYVVSDTTGKQTIYKRDKTNNTFAVTDVQNADSTTSKTTYDANYNELTETDENGKTETNQYDANGNVVKSIDKEGKTTSYIYDGKNQVLEQTDPDGIKTVNTYIGYNLESSTVGEEVTKLEYDGYGRETKVIYPNNTFTTTTYDETNKKTTITDAKGNTTSTSYNDYGEVISETDGENRTTSYSLDLLNPEIKTSVTDGKGNKTTYVYDDNGNMTALTNANGKTKTYKYDGNDELLESVFPVNGSQTIKVMNTYDENGNLITTKQASGISENYVYDNVDQLKTVTVKKGSGQDSLQWTNTYDNAGQLLTRSFKDVAANKILVDKTFTYTANNLAATYKQGNYSTNYSYDEMDRLQNQTTNYSDTSQALMINQTLTYTPEGKVDSVVANNGTDSLISMKYTYDLKQNKAAVSFQNGLIKNNFAYDSSNNLTSIDYTKGTETTPALSFGYTYDKSGNITKATDRNGTAQYFYDANNQLIKEILPNGSTNEYQYDKVGNRTKLIQNGTETNYSYNEGNQITTKNGASTFTYDLDGNLKKDDKFQYEYNDLGDQTRVTTLANSEVTKYEYDEEGLRTKKIIGTKTYEYYYDGEDDNLALEVTKDNNVIQKYRYYQWNDAGKVVGMVV
uniref:DNRLRE domain-containing protein n=1 Tax=Niallia sp. 03133 TaxID=3458060 RepID=UPI0040444719